jgi:hypothetical protein
VVLITSASIAIWFLVGRSGSSERERGYQDEHGDTTPRAEDDPANGRIRGCVSRAGAPVPYARLSATVLPHGMSWTSDSAVASANGCYEIVLTAKHLYRKQVALIAAGAGNLVGELLVGVQPARTTEHADIEVGAGLVIRGVVRDEKGAPVRGVFVTDGTARKSETDREGRFAFRAGTAGRLRLRVHPPPDGNIPRELEQTSPVMFDINRLDGEFGGVTLTIEEQVAQPPHSRERRVAGATSYKIKPVSLRPGVEPPRMGWCTAWARRNDGALEATVTNSGFELDLTPPNVRLTCDQMRGFEDNGRDIELPAVSSAIELPVVPTALNGLELGVELRSHPSGARVVGVAAEAENAGLRPGDIVVAVDGISVAGFEHETVYELGFHVPPGHEVRWTIERGGTRATLHAKAPGPVRSPLYLD